MGGKSLEHAVNVIKRKAGNDLLTTVRDLATKDFVHSVIELVANSYDADATEVGIDYNPRLSVLSIRDNGEGMSPKELENFYRSGDSVKKDHPVTPRGRTKLGKFGVATILLSHLTESYELTTIKEGIKTVARETFGKQLKLEDEIEFSSQKVGKEETGTEIKLIGLRFEEDRFKLNGLRKRIQWDLPVHLPDFKVYVDGEEVIPKKITNATTFEIDEAGKHSGAVRGSVYLLGKSHEDKGIHVYVNGRRIGNPIELLNSFGLRAGTVGKVMGIVNADGLEKIIGFDRTRFKEDEPAFAEFKKIIQEILREVERYERKAEFERDRIEKEKTLEGALRETGERIRKKGISDDNVKIVFKEDMNEKQGLYLQGKKEIYLSREHPILNLPPGTKTQTYISVLEGMAVDALAMHAVKTQGDNIPAFNRERTRLWKMLNGENRRESGTGKKLSLRMLYKKPEVRDYLNLKGGELNYILENGALPEQKNERIKGADILDFELKSKGMISLYSFIYNMYDLQALSSVLPRFNKILSYAGEEISPVIRDLSKNPGELSCFFIESTCMNWMTKIFQEKLDRRKTSDPSGVLRSRLSKLVLMEQIPEILNDVSSEDALKLMEYATENNIKIRFQGNKNRFYRLSDFVKVIQHQRGNYR